MWSTCDFSSGECSLEEAKHSLFYAFLVNFGDVGSLLTERAKTARSMEQRGVGP